MLDVYLTTHKSDINISCSFKILLLLVGYWNNEIVERHTRIE